LVIDVEKFGDPARTNAHQVAIRDGMYQALEGALENAGISPPGCDIEDRGDGAFVLVSPEVPKSWLVTRLPIHMAAALGRHNATCPANARIRLRMAVHAGEVHFDAHGVTGSAVNKTFRLVEAPALKSALDGSAGVLALIVSDWFYDEVVRHEPAAGPAYYRRVRAVVKRRGQRRGYVSWPLPPGRILVSRALRPTGIRAGAPMAAVAWRSWNPAPFVVMGLSSRHRASFRPVRWDS
jgi:hypothetical protein